MAGMGTGIYQTGGPEFGTGIYWTGGPEFGMGVYWTGPGQGMGVYVTGPGQGRGVYLTGCFPQSEFVQTSSETRIPIGSLKVGDKIYSWDVERQKKQYTAVTKIHKYTVMDLIHFNNDLWVSSCHPLLVMEKEENCIFTPKWKAAYDVNVGDCIVGADGKLTIIKSKSRRWFDAGIEVLNLSTDCGAPFLVGNCVVRADNAHDSLEWADTPITQKLVKSSDHGFESDVKPVKTMVL